MVRRRGLLRRCDWEFAFPRIYLIDLSPLAEELDRGEGAGFSGYDPSAAMARQLEADRNAEERAKMRRELDDAHREAVQKAQRGPPPETVKAYETVFGCLPRSWPPSAYRT